MSDHDEQPVEGFAIPIPASLLAKIKADMDHRDMHREDFGNRWDDLLKAAPLETLSTLNELLGLISGQERAATVASYFEGMTTTALVFRTPDDEVKITTNSHEFYQSEDLDNPYCGRCGLPPANQVHHHGPVK